LIPGKFCSMDLPSFNATSRLTLASVENKPGAPWSLPPCPASMMIVCTGFLLISVCIVNDKSAGRIEVMRVQIKIRFNMADI
jgi:hypothetical protein